MGDLSSVAYNMRQFMEKIMTRKSCTTVLLSLLWTKCLSAFYSNALKSCPMNKKRPEKATGYKNPLAVAAPSQVKNCTKQLKAGKTPGTGKRGKNGKS